MNTRAAFIGFGYQLWRRTRWMLLATVAQVVILVVAVHVLGAPDTQPLVGVIVMSFMGITVPFFMQVFTFGGDLSSTESAFPRHMMVLPLSARALAMTPMLYGIAFMAGLWLVVSEFALVPLGAPFPGTWSVLTVAAAVAWLCATSWTPFWFPFGRVIACVGGLSAIVAFTIATRVYSVPEWIIVTGLLTATALAFWMAISGVARARRGDGTVSPWASRRTAGAKPTPLLNPFVSAERAQIWFELRHNCTMVALFVLGMMMLALPLLWESNQHIDLVDFYFVPVSFLATGLFLVLPFLLFTIAAGTFAKPDAWKDTRTAPAFLTARPMSDNFLVLAKIKATTLTILSIWAIVLGLIGISMLIPHGDRQTETLAHFLLRHATPRHVLISIASIAGLVLLSWLAVIKSFALNLYGGKWIPTVRVFATILLIGVIPSIGHWAWKHPESHAALLMAVRILMCVLIAAKIAVALPIIRAVRRRHIASSSQLVTWTALWFLAAATLLGITFWLVPAARHSALSLVAGVVLLLPYNRMISMPLAWHHNRHR
jgi:hypothetical protein